MEEDRADALERYKQLLDSGAISQDEYDVLKAEVIANAVSATNAASIANATGQNEDHIPEKTTEASPGPSSAANHGVGEEKFAAKRGRGLPSDPRPAQRQQSGGSKRGKGKGAGSSRIQIAVVVALIITFGVLGPICILLSLPKYVGDVEGVIDHYMAAGKTGEYLVQVTGYVQPVSSTDDEKYFNLVDTMNEDSHILVCLKDGTRPNFGSKATVRGRIECSIPGDLSYDFDIYLIEAELL